MLYQHFHMTKRKENLLRRLLSHVLILFLAVVALPGAQPADDKDEGSIFVCLCFWQQMIGDWSRNTGDWECGGIIWES